MPKLKFNCQGKSRYWSFYGRLGKLTGYRILWAFRQIQKETLVMYRIRESDLLCYPNWGWVALPAVPFRSKPFINAISYAECWRKGAETQPPKILRVSSPNSRRSPEYIVIHQATIWLFFTTQYTIPERRKEQVSAQKALPQPVCPLGDLSSSAVFTVMISKPVGGRFLSLSFTEI